MVRLRSLLVPFCIRTHPLPSPLCGVLRKPSRLSARRQARTLLSVISSRIHLTGLASLVLGASLATGCVKAEVAPTVLPPSPTIRVETVSPRPPTPTAYPGACPVPAGNPGSVDLSDPAATTDAILSFLNAGGSAVDLGDRIKASGRAGGQADPTRELDLNGDGWFDAVLTLTDPPGNQGGSVIVLLCQGDRYVLGASQPLEDATASPILHADAELTGDASSNVLLGWRTCGAHTCLERLEVLSVSGMRVVRHALDPSADLPYPEITIPADGSVAVTATGIGSVGAGPFRRFTRTWIWDPPNQGFRLVSEESEPPRYRIHALLDADAAARRGELQAALDLYHRVALDDSLLDWVDPEAERANLTGYAMFRAVLTYLEMNDEGDAQKAYGILQNQYPSGAVGQPYASMAQPFWDAYTATRDLEQACLIARDYAESHADEILTPLYFGYANPVYTSADVCPVEDL